VLETPHVIVGAAIATKIPNPVIALPLVLASHFVLDMTPHWNPHLNTEMKKYGDVTIKSKYIVVLDLITASASGLYFISQAMPDTGHALTIGAAAILSILPDAIEGPYFFWHWRHKAIEKWIAFQKSIQSDTNVYAGLAVQFVTVIAAFWWAFN